MRLGQKVLEMLVIHNKKQNELAKAIDVSAKTISSWKDENRNPSWNLIVPICRFFGITPNELLEFDASAAGLDDDEKELLDLFRSLDRRGKRAILHEADVQMDRVRLEGDNHKAAQ